MDREVLVASPEAFDGQAFLAEHGLEELAEQQVEAHGGSFTVVQALAECRPFAQMITSMAVSLEHVPDRTEILKKTIQTMAVKTREEPGSEAKKKLN